MSVENRLICAARSAWYRAYEGSRLRRERNRWWNKEIHYECRYGLMKMMAGPDDPLVTCYIPTFNRADILLSRALPSVKGQTYTNLEIIVAAHGCTDGTEARVRALDDRRLHVLSVPRTRTYPPTAENHWLAGPVIPANAALHASRGAWLSRVDDDDEWTPDHVEKLLRFAQSGDYEFVSSAYVRSEPGRESGRDGDYVTRVGPDRSIGGTQTWLYRSYLKFMRYNPDCWRKTHDRVNDLDLAERFRRAGVRIGYLDDATCIIRPRPGETEIGSAAYRNNAERIERAYRFG